MLPKRLIAGLMLLLVLQTCQTSLHFVSSPFVMTFVLFRPLDSRSSKNERLLSSPSSFVILRGLNGVFDKGRAEGSVT